MTTAEIQLDEKRLAKIAALSLGKGKHSSLKSGACVMEAVSYVAGEPWSDAPQCASPVITAFLVSWNDSLPNDADRDRLLKPLVPLIVNSRATPEVEERRSYMALDWLIRVFTPQWLDLVPALHEHAVALRGLDEIADMAGAAAAGVKVRAANAASYQARDAAWAAAGAAAWDAAGAAAWAAAWAAAGDAARAAARDAAGAAAWAAAWATAWATAGDAAGAAAWAAAGDAAGAAAGDAAGAAAGDAVKPTTEWLQTSAVALVHRMLAAA